MNPLFTFIMGYLLGKSAGSFEFKIVQEKQLKNNLPTTPTEKESEC